MHARMHVSDCPIAKAFCSPSCSLDFYCQIVEAGVAQAERDVGGDNGHTENHTTMLRDRIDYRDGKLSIIVTIFAKAQS